MTDPIAIRSRVVAGHNLTWLDTLMAAVVIVGGCIVMSNNLPEPDLWGHVQYGRDAIAHGLPETATYTFTAAGHPWVNHEILSEIALAYGMDHFGSSVLLVAKCVLAAPPWKLSVLLKNPRLIWWQ